MAVSDSFREFVLDQLQRAARDIRMKRMFGGVGIYAGERFFALIDDDTLYFKVDDTTRPKFLRRRMRPFQPYGEQGGTMGYYQVPVGVLEDAGTLKAWVADAVAVAERAARKPSKRQRPARSRPLPV